MCMYVLSKREEGDAAYVCFYQHLVPGSLLVVSASYVSQERDRDES